MTYWEPIATPGSHMEPPDPEENDWCEWCEEQYAYCDCHQCEECGERCPCTKTIVDDDEYWLCKECKKKRRRPE